MTVVCSVPQCKNRFITNGKYKFHIFPKTFSLRKHWIIALRIGNKLSKYAKVCGAHFNVSDYRLLGSKTGINLKPNTVPSKNIPRRQFEMAKPVEETLHWKAIYRILLNECLDKPNSAEVEDWDMSDNSLIRAVIESDLKIQTLDGQVSNQKVEKRPLDVDNRNIQKKPICSVLHCQRKPGASLYRLPTTAIRFKWLSQLQLNRNYTLINYFVCEHHFKSSDFKKKIHPNQTTLRLKPDVYPTCNLPPKSTKNVHTTGKPEQTSKQASTEISIKEETDSDTEASSAARETEIVMISDILKQQNKVTRYSHVSKNETTSRQLSSTGSKSIKHKIEYFTLKDMNYIIRNVRDSVRQKGTAMEEDDNDNNLYEMNGIEDNTINDFEYPIIEPSFIDSIKTIDDLKCWTGLPNFNCLRNIERSVCNIESVEESLKHFQIPIDLLIVLVCVRIKVNLSFRQMSLLFKIPPNILSKYFYAFLPILKAALTTILFWPSKKQYSSTVQKFVTQKNINYRIECNSVDVESDPLNTVCSRLKLCSGYRSQPNIATEISVNSTCSMKDNSLVNYIKASEKQILIESNILEKCKILLVDKEYTVPKERNKKSVDVSQPKFVQSPHLSEEDPLSDTSIPKSNQSDHGKAYRQHNFYCLLYC